MAKSVGKAAKSTKVERTPVLTDDITELINSVVTNVNKKIKDEEQHVTVGDDDSEYGKQVPYWVRTMIPQLDYAIGGRNHPGIPGARIIEIFGGEGSGKSTISVWITKCAVEQLKTFAVYQDAENVLTPEIIKGTRLNMKQIVLQNPSTLEEVFTTQESTLEVLEKNSKKRPVITVLDSVAACSTEAEMEAEYGDSTVATHARMMSKALRKIKGLVLNNQVLSIFVNQIRDKVGVTYGKTTTTTGGKALPFYASVRIEMSRTSYLKKTNSKEPYGGTYQAVLIKNKVAPPMKVAEFDIMYIEDLERGWSYPQINIWKACCEWCKTHGLLEGAQGRVILPDGRNLYLSQATEVLQNDDELFQQIVDLAYSVGAEESEEEEVDE